MAGAAADPLRGEVVDVVLLVVEDLLEQPGGGRVADRAHVLYTRPQHRDSVLLDGEVVPFDAEL